MVGGGGEGRGGLAAKVLATFTEKEIGNCIRFRKQN